MSDRSHERERLDLAAAQWGTMPARVIIPYVLGYLITVLISVGSPRPANGVFGVVLAILTVGSFLGPWRHADLSRRARGALLAGAAGLGVVVGVLVGVVGLS